MSQPKGASRAGKDGCAYVRDGAERRRNIPGASQACAEWSDQAPHMSAPKNKDIDVQMCSSSDKPYCCAFESRILSCGRRRATEYGQLSRHLNGKRSQKISSILNMNRPIQFAYMLRCGEVEHFRYSWIFIAEIFETRPRT